MSCDSEDVAVEVSHVTKTYEIYTKPSNRLRQTLFFGRKNFYKEFNALKDISFTVRKGQCFGIMGMNGAGKSTLRQIFAGTLAPPVPGPFVRPKALCSSSHPWKRKNGSHRL